MRVIVYTGKGGVGKSVISAATGVKLASLGYKVLVISSDPAHTIFSCLGIQVSKDVTSVMRGLDIIAVDPIREMREKFKATSSFLIDWFKSRGLDEVLAYELAMLPTMTEAIGLLKILDYLEKYDVIVLDTVPAGDTLRLLYLPRVSTSIYRRLLRFSSVLANGINKALTVLLGTRITIGDMIREEKMFFEYLEKLAKLLEDPKITSIRVIANPDSMSVEDAVRTVGLAQVFNLNVDLGVFNKVLPESIGLSLRGWLNKQKHLLETFKTSLYPIPVRIARLLESEIKGLDMLYKLADMIYGDDDPAKVYYIGKAVEIVRRDDSVDVILKLPGNVRDCTSITSLKDEVIIELETDTGTVEKILPLPTMLHLMKPTTADFKPGELILHFKHVE